jgi:hypothetical protein
MHSSAKNVEMTTTGAKAAQRMVGAAMTACLAMWFVPFVSGVACNIAERKLTTEILKSMGCQSPEATDKIFWFFRKKTMFLNVTTYIPVAGMPLQLFETYGIGQFSIHCATRPDLLAQDWWLEQAWREVESDIFSGEHAIESYVQFTGKPFPDFARGKFISTVNVVNKLYLLSQSVPGAARAQEAMGGAVQTAVDLGKGGLKWAVDRFRGRRY